MKFILEESETKKFILQEDADPLGTVVEHALDNILHEAEEDLADVTGLNLDFGDSDKPDTTGDRATAMKDGSENWDARFEEARKGLGETTAECWQAYLEAEWGDKGKTIDKLGSAFMTETKTYGFSETNNPFIKFLKGKFTDSTNVIDFAWTDTIYGSLHNALADGKIAKDELTDPEKTKSYQSLVYCKNLYEHSAFDIKTYFKFFKEAISKTGEIKLEKAWKIGDTNLEKETILKANKDGENEFIKTLFFKTPDNYILRDSSEVSQAWTALTGETLAEKKPMTDEGITKLVNSIESGKELNSFIFVYTKYYSAEWVNKLKQAIKEDDDKTLESKFITVMNSSSYKCKSIEDLWQKLIKPLNSYKITSENFIKLEVAILKKINILGSPGV